MDKLLARLSDIGVVPTFWDGDWCALHAPACIDIRVVASRVIAMRARNDGKFECLPPDDAFRPARRMAQILDEDGAVAFADYQLRKRQRKEVYVRADCLAMGDLLVTDFGHHTNKVLRVTKDATKITVVLESFTHEVGLDDAILVSVLE